MCDGVAAYRTSLCQSPAIWSRIREISSSGTTTNTSDKSIHRRFVELIYKLTKFAARACRPMSEQPSQNTDKLTSRSANGRAKRRPTQIDHLPSATQHKRAIGHYVLPCGAGYCLWTRGFSGRRAPRCPLCRWWWGFCSIRSWLPACRRRVVVLMTPFPPFGGGDVAV